MCQWKGNIYSTLCLLIQSVIGKDGPITEKLLQYQFHLIIYNNVADVFLNFNRLSISVFQVLSQDAPWRMWVGIMTLCPSCSTSSATPPPVRPSSPPSHSSVSMSASVMLTTDTSTGGYGRESAPGRLRRCGSSWTRERPTRSTGEGMLAPIQM